MTGSENYPIPVCSASPVGRGVPCYRSSRHQNCIRVHPSLDHVLLPRYLVSDGRLSKWVVSVPKTDWYLTSDDLPVHGTANQAHNHHTCSYRHVPSCRCSGHPTQSLSGCQLSRGYSWRDRCWSDTLCWHSRVSHLRVASAVHGG